MLANVLDHAPPGQTIALVVLADGATAMVLRTTGAIASYRRGSTVKISGCSSGGASSCGWA